MSIFSRLAAGVGSAAAGLADKYITAEMEQQKAQALADIQFANAKRLDEYQLSDERQGKLTAAEAARERAVGAARNETALAGKTLELTDPTYRSAKRTAGDEDAANETRRKVEAVKAMTPAEVERIEKMTPAEVKRAGLMEEARGRASAKFREAPPSVQKKVADIEGVLGRKMNERELMAVMGIAAKDTRDPELDTQTVTEEKMNPDGTTVKTVRKEVRRPGAQQGGAKPTTEQAHAMASDAITKGADPAAVNARLKEAGYPTLPGKEPKATAAPKSPEQQQSERIASMDAQTFAAYQKMQSGEPTNPQERQLLRRAGITQ